MNIEELGWLLVIGLQFLRGHTDLCYIRRFFVDESCAFRVRGASHFATTALRCTIIVAPHGPQALCRARGVNCRRSAVFLAMVNFDSMFACQALWVFRVSRS